MFYSFLKNCFDITRLKCFESPKIIYRRWALKAFWKLLTTSLYFANYLLQQWRFMKVFSHLLKIIIWSNSLHIYFYAYVQERFSVSWKNLHSVEVFYAFVTEHHINLSLILNQHFNISICCQSLVISFKCIPSDPK